MHLDAGSDRMNLFHKLCSSGSCQWSCNALHFVTAATGTWRPSWEPGQDRCRSLGGVVWGTSCDPSLQHSLRASTARGKYNNDYNFIELNWPTDKYWHWVDLCRPVHIFPLANDMADSRASQFLPRCSDKCTRVIVVHIGKFYIVLIFSSIRNWHILPRAARALPSTAATSCS